MNQQNRKTAFELFTFFFRIGCFTFGGGWSILAQMEQEFVEKEQVLTKEELVELAAVGKSIPGIMISNIAVLFGCRMCGWIGGVAAMLGITCPAVLILSAVVYGYDMLRDNFWCHCALKGIQSAVIPIIGSVACSLGREVFSNVKGKTIGVIVFLLFVFTGISNIALVLSGAAAALAWRGVKKHGIF